MFLGKAIPTFKYKDNEGTTHTYHPDIMVKSDNRILIIEVKSIYTFNNNSRINYLKFITVNKTHNLDVYIYKNEKTLFDIWAFRLNKKPYSLMNTNIVISDLPIIV